MPGHVAEMMVDRSANWVLQAIFEKLPPENALCELVVQELQSQAAGFALHRFGCRVLCRMLEHGRRSQQLLLLVDEMLSCDIRIFTSPYGSPVAECILNLGSEPHRHTIGNMLKSNIALAKDKYASHVVELFLETDDDASCELAACLVQHQNLWTRSQYGRHVAKLLKPKGYSLTTRGGRARGGMQQVTSSRCPRALNVSSCVAGRRV